jgi:hypothetical protein
LHSERIFDRKAGILKGFDDDFEGGIDGEPVDVEGTAF